MRYEVIAIEREYASGGSEIGATLAAQLGLPCYGQEVLQKAAATIGVPASDVEQQEETIPSGVGYTLHVISQPPIGEPNPLTQAQQLALAEVKVVRDLAAEGPCVIVGRAAAGILQDEPSVLTVFVRADMDTRLRRAAEEYGHGSDHAAAILRRFDKRRSRYYKAVSGRPWGDPASFHIVLDSGKLGIDVAVDILRAAVDAPA